VRKAAELRAMTREDLEKQLLELLKEQFNLRMQRGSGQLGNPSRFKAVRREIARIKTVLERPPPKLLRQPRASPPNRSPPPRRASAQAQATE
jgi:large subunit ribosomal protein L29